jgi:adenylate kinase family enzyme
MIVGLTGPSGAHKTVVAKHLQKSYGFNRYHAGTPIKNAVRKGYGLSKEQVGGKGKDRPAPQLGGAHPREILEAHGVATHTAAPYATAAALHKKILKSTLKGKSIVVDGIRSPHEEAVVRRLGGTMWRADNGKGADPKLPMDRRSEEVKADQRVDTSSGDKDNIRSNVDEMMSKHLGINFAAGTGPTRNKGTP